MAEGAKSWHRSARSQLLHGRRDGPEQSVIVFITITSVMSEASPQLSTSGADAVSLFSV